MSTSTGGTQPMEKLYKVYGRILPLETANWESAGNGNIGVTLLGWVRLG